ncbi:MAG TPA: MBL fold metallo-hydrolase [Beijerinckia sp.]|jgi:ribonuclease BN (tRNA processing enzyme)|nr:MBL fold metallo-hydrolase [Beijerinckia sp.]
MKITIVGSGDAFTTGGRAHTCIRIDANGATILIDFGAASIAAFKKLGFSSDKIDAVIISHLHGDHFGGLPFLLLDCQFMAKRTRPLRLIGPTGFKAQLDAALEALFPGTPTLSWSFPWHVEETPARHPLRFSGLIIETFEVPHVSSGLSTGIRISDGKTIFAYSGDTEWSEVLFELSAGADIFVIECYSGEKPVAHHMDWPKLKAKLPGFTAKRIIVTHMNQSALARASEMEQAGLTIAYDGLSFDL